MQRLLTREDVKQIDLRASRRYGLCTRVLMENAGAATAAWLRRRQETPQRAVVVCGRGHNGGDGAVAARHLNTGGWDVSVVWLCEPRQMERETRRQYQILRRAGVFQLFVTERVLIFPWVDFFQNYDWIIDAIFGIGLSRPVEGWPLEAIRSMNESGKRVLSVDVPSGLDANRGEVLGAAVRAFATITFVAAKIGFYYPGAGAYLGEVSVAGIGLPLKLLREFGQNCV